MSHKHTSPPRLRRKGEVVSFELPHAMATDDSLSRDEFPVSTPLHMSIEDPRSMTTFVASNHVLTSGQTTIVHSHSTISESSDENVASDLIASEGRKARVGASGKIL